MAIVVKGYPRLSETFITREFLALEECGIDFLVVSLRHPTDRLLHNMNERVRASVLYLPEYLHQDMIRLLSAVWKWIFSSSFWRLTGIWVLDFVRDLTVNRVRRLGQAIVLAAELPPSVRHLHIHYLHTPASVGRYAALLRGCSYSLSAHAKDIWTTPRDELREKLVGATSTVTCTKSNLDYLRELAPTADIELMYHGVDVERFSPKGFPTANGRTRLETCRICCVSRAVPKKGLGIMLEALALLPADFDWTFEHAGGGPDIGALRGRAQKLGIAGRVVWSGSVTLDRVQELLQRSDMFCLPALIAADGDRDGLPNVILEAMAAGLPVVATHISAIPEAVEHGRTGILVPSGDAPALADAIASLGRDKERRSLMGRAAREKVVREFSSNAGIDRLVHRLRAPSPRVCA